MTAKADHQFNPDRTKRPQTSEALRHFKAAITEINHFYWLALAGGYALQAPASGGAVPAGVPADVSRHLNLSATDVRVLVDAQARRLRQLCLVDAVAHYEGFLERVVREKIASEPLPTDKAPKIQVHFGDLQPHESAETYLKRVWVEHRTAEILNEGYLRRVGAVAKVFGADGATSEHGLSVSDLNAAQLFRNCIVHCRGIVDERTKSGCGDAVPMLKIGQPLPLDQALLMRLLAAMRKHAQDIDLFARVPARRRTKKRR